MILDFIIKTIIKTTERKFITMNRNRKLRKQMMSGLAVGMAAVMGAAPVYAATGGRSGFQRRNLYM